MHPKIAGEKARLTQMLHNSIAVAFNYASVRDPINIGCTMSIWQSKLIVVVDFSMFQLKQFHTQVETTQAE